MWDVPWDGLWDGPCDVPWDGPWDSSHPTAHLRLGHLPDGDNYIDYATKFVSKDKEDASVAYISNSRSRAAHGDAVAEAVACVVSFDVGRARAHA